MFTNLPNKTINTHLQRSRNLSNLIILDRNKLDIFKEQMNIYVNSGMLPDTINTPQKAFAIAQKGRELGIAPMEAFSSISIIKGKPTLSAELMMALIYKNCPQAIINFEELSDERCIIEAQRDNKHKPTKISFSIDDAKRAGLDGQYSWKKYTRALLRSRAVSEMARAIFPDALVGCSYTAEELGDTSQLEREPEIENDGVKHRDVSPVEIVTDKVASIIKQQIEQVKDSEEVTNFAQPIVDQAKEKFDALDTSDPMEAVMNFEFKFGKFSGKKFDDIPPAQLQGWVKWADTQPELKSVVADAKHLAIKYLETYELENK